MVRKAEYKKPLPEIRDDTRRFWEGCKRHELLIQRCSDCGTYRHPPRPLCHKCNSLGTEWVKIAGKGIVYSYSVVHNNPTPGPLSPGFEKDLPLAIVLVELPEAGKIRMVSNIIDCKLEDIKIGMPVEVVFDDVTDQISLPKFKPSIGQTHVRQKARRKDRLA